MKILFTCEMTKDLYPELVGISNLLKPNHIILDNSYDFIDLKYHIKFPDISIGRGPLIRHPDTKIYLSYGEPISDQWFSKRDMYTEFNINQIGYSLSFVFFELDASMIVSNAYHPHAYINFYRSNVKGIPAIS